jgi:hypothetical protein|tara:strand:+ start:109 stop:561 length:453 start_codon:yes stop_codon:yes gene_type:complete
MTKKQEKIWSYKVDHPTASVSEVAKATKSSYGYVYKLFQSISTPKEVFEAEAKARSVPPLVITTRSTVLDLARKYVTKDRAEEHGNMGDNFAMIAGLWSVYLGKEIKPHDVGAMMTLLKTARIKSNPAHLDNWVDGAGYMACGGELATDK